jgi:hypothetical protein
MISDPRVQTMNDTRWAFEYETLRLKETRRSEEVGTIFKAGRRELINLLGLNMMPLEDPETHLLRRPGENDYIPLAVMTAREGMVEAFIQKNEELMQQEQAAKDLELEETTGKAEMMSSEELDDFMKEDIVFLDDPEELKKRAVMASPETKWLTNNVVKTLEDEKKIKEDKDAMKVAVQSEAVELAPVSKSKRRVVITAE